METYLTVASSRAVRHYAERPIPEEVVARIFDAGRVAGSAGNRQPWQFVVIGQPALTEEVAGTVWEPANIRGAALVVAVVVPIQGQAGFDAGRAAQNMILTAWDQGVGSCPNGVRDTERFAQLLGLQEGERAAAVLSFGYPARPLDPGRRSPEEWIARADRRPLDAVVRRA